MSMNKWNRFNDLIIRNLQEKNNTKLAKKLYPEGSYLELERFRRHIANLRTYGLPN